MFLSRLELNLQNRQVLADLGDSHNLHRTIMRAFGKAEHGEAARAEFGVLYRVEWLAREERAVLLVQSMADPSWSQLPAGYAADIRSKSITAPIEALTAGQRLAFRLRANPTRKIGTSSKSDRLAGQKNNGKRVPVAEAGLGDWLSGKGTSCGFRVINAAWRIQPQGSKAPGVSSGWRQGKRLTHAIVVFEGVLEVTAPGTFQEALRRGIGSGKAYGCGLLTVAADTGVFE
jgi:CRISPR system Cascade subunit CasE